MTAIPYLIVDNASSAIKFYIEAFNAVEHVRLTMPMVKVAHAEIRIDGAKIMVADAFPEMDYKSPADLGGSAVSVLLYVADADTTFANTVRAGGTSISPPSDQFDGDRRGTLTDPFGHRWLIATKREDVAPDELVRRFSAMMTKE